MTVGFLIVIGVLFCNVGIDARPLPLALPQPHRHLLGLSVGANIGATVGLGGSPLVSVNVPIQVGVPPTGGR